MLEGLQWEGLVKLACKRESLCGRDMLSSQSSICGKFSYGDVVLCENFSLDTGVQSDEEAKGPEVYSTLSKFFSGENMLNKCLCVKVRAYMQSESFL